MRKLIIILFLFPFIVFSEEYILVKNIWGKVNLIKSEKKVNDLTVYSTIDRTHQIELLNIESKVWIRDNNHNDIIIEYCNLSSNNKANKYSYDDIKNLIKANNNTPNSEKSFANQFFSLISLPTKERKSQVNGMLISSKTGVSRNLHDTNITFLEDILILEDMPFKIDFSNLIDNNDGAVYSVLINDKFSKKKIFEFEISEPFFELENKNIKGSLSVNWGLKISSSKNSKILLSNISSLYLSSESKKLLRELKDKALNEIGSSESMFQMIFIEVLYSKCLDANARYYLDYFSLKLKNKN